MSLRDHLNELLPDFLPADPREAVKGTELIRLVQLKLEGNYSDASLRYHFSIMSCDPTSPIAKVERGQGYYLRTSQVPALSSAQDLLSLRQGQLAVMGEEEMGHETLGRSSEQISRLQKFHTIVQKYYERLGQFPFVFRKSLDTNAPLGNLWRFPEMALIEWELEENEEGIVKIDQTAVRTRQLHSLPPYLLKGLRLRTICSHETYREDFFQTLSASEWTQGGTLCYAGGIEDEALLEKLRYLSNLYGVGVTSFGLSVECLDDLPSPAHLLSSNPRETEALMDRIEVSVISSPRLRSHFDWKALSLTKRDSGEIQELFDWIERCSETGTIEAITPLKAH